MTKTLNGVLGRSFFILGKHPKIEPVRARLSHDLKTVHALASKKMRSQHRARQKALLRFIDECDMSGAYIHLFVGHPAKTRTLRAGNPTHWLGITNRAKPLSTLRTYQ